jgi:2-haloalkanoic acid dehalogenase type II
MKGSLPRAILLDFYGTVVEEDDVPFGEICGRISAASPLKVAAAEIASYWSHVFRQLCSRSFGDTFQLQRELVLLSLRQVLQHFRVDLDAIVLSQILYDYWAHPVIFPESKGILAQCEIPICLVSNIDNTELYSALEYNGLHFDYIVTSEDCRAYKPRQEMFIKALSLVGLPEADVLHVGDSFNSDVRGAKGRGMPVLWVNRKEKPHPSIGISADYVSLDLTGLLTILGREKGGEVDGEAKV